MDIIRRIKGDYKELYYEEQKKRDLQNKSSILTIALTKEDLNLIVDLFDIVKEDLISSIEKSYYIEEQLEFVTGYLNRYYNLISFLRNQFNYDYQYQTVIIIRPTQFMLMKFQNIKLIKLF